MAATPIHTFTKDPNAVLDYTINWSLYLGSDTISTSTFTVEAGLTKNSESNTTTTSTVWLSGGTDGTNYSVACRIVTAAGRTDDRTFRVTVGER